MKKNGWQNLAFWMRSKTVGSNTKPLREGSGYLEERFMPFYPFAVEQFLSEFEQTADYNYTESGVHPLEFGPLPVSLLDVKINS
jgi:hypothetical protein